MSKPLRVLFVCRLNMFRSPTAERLFSKRADLEVRSAGTNADARVRVNERMLEWADVIFAMDSLEDGNLRTMFPAHRALERIVCLDIPDEFRFNDPKLIELLQERVDRSLKE